MQTPRPSRLVGSSLHADQAFLPSFHGSEDVQTPRPSRPNDGNVVCHDCRPTNVVLGSSLDVMTEASQGPGVLPSSDFDDDGHGGRTPSMLEQIEA